jgi:RimJ/RimL family protein N-acetyltransferase
MGTAQLRLLPLGIEDTGELHRLWNAPGVLRQLWGDHVLRLEQTRDLVAQSAWLFEQQGYGFWGAFDRDGELVGFCGYWFFRNDHDLELLYGVREDRWLRGYAREMAAALVGYGFESLGLRELRASTEADNTGSQRVLARLGFVADHERGGLGAGPRYFRLPRQRRDSGDAAWGAA